MDCLDNKLHKKLKLMLYDSLLNHNIAVMHMSINDYPVINMLILLLIIPLPW